MSVNPCPPRLLRNQKGAALIAALLAAVLVTTLASAMIFTQQLDIRRSANIMHGDQAYLYALGMESWAALQLGRAKPMMERESLDRDLTPFMVEGGQLRGRIADLQARFNINNLILIGKENREQQRLQFRRLLRGCGLNERLEQAVSAWMEGEPARRKMKRPMLDHRELSLINGFDNRACEQCLWPLLSALPEATALNVNTAPAQLLASLSDKLGLGGAEQLVAGRTGRGYANLADFLAQPALAKSGLTAEAVGSLTLQSNYYLVQTEAAIGQSRVELYSVLKREADTVRVIRRNR
ncbi:MAG: hypothetical protein A2505_00355 [Deltaproteobacteria bacterium RIFOXYD12_FULL_55_16]|nr:MAG: hypothetical protein A2505_00355 [Deltaproteobacteria bacterium RIFOXYD12_FULL_55_16]